MGYVELVRRNPRFLGFGFLLSALSVIGTAYFFGIFANQLREI